MSVRTMARVWELSSHTGTALLMMLAIADFADDDGNAYPSVATLARKCRMKPRNAQVLLAALRASGELEVRANEGPKGANRYRIVLREGVQSLAGVQRFAGVQGNARGGAKPCASPLQGIAPEPSLNRQEPITSASRARRTSSSQDSVKYRLAKTSKGTALAKPEGVSEETWTDFLELRKGKRAPVTTTALEGIAHEASQAGVSLEDALRVCCVRGWAGFKAEWVKGGGVGHAAAAGKDYSKGVTHGRLI